MSAPASERSRSLFQPLRVPVFRALLAANVVSDIGAFMQAVGAAWLMISLGAGPFYVALAQTATAIPFFLFALPAGVVGDIVDRRRLILVTELWMFAVAVVLAVTTLTGHATPWLLLGLTFALSAGDAVEAPSWRALLPDLVPRADLPAASALNGIEFNIARATGPALAGVLIAAAGVGAVFVVNAASFLGVIFVVARWKRAADSRTGPAEHLGGATAAAVRYIRHAPTVRAVILRSGAVMLCASAAFALLPSVAHRVSSSALTYGVLLGCWGAGAILGALAMQWARAKWSTETMVSASLFILAVAIVAVGRLRAVQALVVALLVAGGAWIVVISLVSALVQILVPDWIRARVLSIFLLVTQGALAAGSALWGWVALRSELDDALLWAGIGTAASIALRFVAPLPEDAGDLTPWDHWRMPAFAAGEPGLDEGPVLVTVEYHVAKEHARQFLSSMARYERIRRRGGASRWGIYKDIERPDLYLETFVVASWAEHLRQHQRVTRSDAEIEHHLKAYTRGDPLVRHYIHPASREPQRKV